MRGYARCCFSALRIQTHQKAFLLLDIVRHKNRWNTAPRRMRAPQNLTTRRAAACSGMRRADYVTPALATSSPEQQSPERDHRPNSGSAQEILGKTDQHRTAFGHKTKLRVRLSQFGVTISVFPSRRSALCAARFSRRTRCQCGSGASPAMMQPCGWISPTTVARPKRVICAFTFVASL